MKILESFKQCMLKESKAISDVAQELGQEIEEAIVLMMNCQGKVVISGVGKSGIVGKKIAATLASTGTPAFFMHSTEGLHGDLGMIEEEDLVILISNSGTTKEVLDLIPSLQIIGCKLIAITGDSNSILANKCDVVISYGKRGEADHLGLAPTISSTIVLVIGDALAVTLSQIKGFTKEDFGLFHPGGALGKLLLEKGEVK